MTESDAPPRAKPGWVGRYLVYPGLAVGIPWLAAALAHRDCLADQRGRGDDGLCGLAYVAVMPIAFVIVVVVLLGVEIVWRARRG